MTAEVNSASNAAPPHLYQPTYRPDIDGLRAVAVLAVVAYHAFPDGVRGGFVGVDIFFVISGFLISTIIFGSLARGTFTFAEFYERRVRRIFPALATVLATTLLLGWFVLFAEEYRQLGKHTAGAAAFLTNFALLREAGYFDASADTKPLLHLWSLAIEEQFYIFWPALLYWAARKNFNPRRLCIALLILSFLINIRYIGRDPVAAFYVPTARLWELIAGGLLAHTLFFTAGNGTASGIPPAAPALRNATAVIGIVLIAAALILLDPHSTFPGWWALLPVVGTMALIWAGPAAWLNRRILAHPGMVAIGLISYPLYLWHWPLLTLARILNGTPPEPLVRAGIVLLSFILATLTYWLIEMPLRRRRGRGPLAGLIAAMCAIALVGCGAFLQLVQRADPAGLQKVLFAATDRPIPPRWDGRNLNPVTLGDPAQPSILFLGDSHMDHYMARIKLDVERGVGDARGALVVSAGGCPPIPRVEVVNLLTLNCGDFYTKGIALANDERIVTVVLSAYWDWYFLGGPALDVGTPSGKPSLLSDSETREQAIVIGSPQWQSIFDRLGGAIASLRAQGKRVFLILPNPASNSLDPRRFIDARTRLLRVSVTASIPELARADAVNALSAINARLRAAAESNGAVVIDPLETICPTTQCRTQVDGRPTNSDADHLTATFALEHAAYIDRVFFK